MDDNNKIVSTVLNKYGQLCFDFESAQSTIEKTNQNIPPIDTKKNTSPQVLTTDANSKNPSMVGYLQNFVNSDKSICTFQVGTGFGKSHAFTEFATWVIRQTENTIVYVTDRIALVDEAKDKTLECPELRDHVLLIRNNVENLMEHLKEIEAFCNIDKELFSEFRQKLRNKVRLYQEALKKWPEGAGEYEDELRNLDREFRKQIQAYIKKKHPELEKKKTNEKKLEYIQKHPDLSLIMDIYPATWLPFKRALFLTLQKALLNIDTIFFGKCVVTDRKFSKNAIFFLDESDACKDVILTKMIDDARKNELDAKTLLKHIQGVATLIIDKTAPLMWTENPEIAKQAQEFLDIRKTLADDYYLDHSFYFAENVDTKKQYMYSLRSPMAVDSVFDAHKISNMKPQYMYLEEDGRVCVTTQEISEKTKPMREMIERVNDACLSGVSLLQMILEEKMKQPENEYRLKMDVCNDIINYGMKVTQDTILSTSIVHLMCNERMLHKQIHTTSGNFYENGFNIISLEEDPMDVRINFFSLVETPEKLLLDICRSSGKVILSSATAAMNNLYGNFALSYPEISQRIYEPTDEDFNILNNYIAYRTEYAKDYLEHEKLYPFETEGDVESLMKTFSSTLAVIENTLTTVYDVDQLEENLYNKLNTMYHTPECSQENGFYFKRACGRINAILMSFRNKDRQHLSLAPYNIIPDRDEFDPDGRQNGKIFTRMISLFSQKLQNEMCFLYFDSKRIQSATEKAQKAVDEGRFIVLVSSYATCGKGLNITFKQQGDVLKACVPLNSFAKDSLATAIAENRPLEIDIDSMSLTCPRHLPPDIDFKNPEQMMTSMMKCLYTAEELYAEQEISGKQLTQTISRLLARTSWTMQNLSPISNLAKCLVLLIQAVGRCGRKGIKRDHTSIYVDEKIIRMFKEYGDIDQTLRQIGLTPERLNMQSLETNTLIEYIRTRCKEKQQTSVHPQARQYCKHADYVHMKCFRAMRDRGEAEIYYILRDSIGKPLLSAEEYNALPKDVQAMYMPVKVLSGYERYNIRSEGDDENGDRIITSVIPVNNTETAVYSLEALRHAVCYDTNLEIREALLRGGIDLEEENNPAEYVLTPKGFDILWGNIGEALLDHYVISHYFGTPNILPDEICEVADRVVETDDVVFAFDAKFFNNRYAQKREEQQEENNAGTNSEDRFADKIKKLQAYYNKPVKFFVINTRANKDYQKFRLVTPYEVEAGGMTHSVIKIPNLFDSQYRMLPEVAKYFIGELVA